MESDGSFIEVNAARQTITIRPIQNGQEVLIVIGEDLKGEKIGAYWSIISKKNARKMK